MMVRQSSKSAEVAATSIDGPVESLMGADAAPLVRAILTKHSGSLD